MVDYTAWLNAEEIERYGRHLVLPDVGPSGQERLKSASVVLVGAGGLGSPASLYLAAAGIGRIGLVDFDRVDLSNLQRQILYGTEDVGRSKAEAAAERLQSTNPHVTVEAHQERLSPDNALSILGRYDVVLDGTDNFPTRYLVNDACVFLSQPNVYGSVFRFQGQASVFHAGHGPCYRCLFPTPPDATYLPDCAEGGVLGVLPGIIGAIQAAEAIKLVLGRGESLTGRLLLFEALEMRFREMSLRRDPECPVCGSEPRIRNLEESAASCGADPNRTVPELTAPELRSRMESDAGLQVLDVRTPLERSIARIEGSVEVDPEDLDSWIEQARREHPVVVYCHVGILSAQIARRLLRSGFDRVWNLAGGIDAWSRQVDPEVPRY